MTERRQALTSAALVIALSLALSAPASVHAVQSRVVRATGHMTVSASSLVYTELHIPQGTRLSFDYYSEGKHPTPRFSKGSEFGAIVLVSETNRADSYLAARLEKSPGVSQRLVSLGKGICQVRDFCEIPTGNYRLYVVTNDRLRVEIEFQGLKGSSTITPTTKAIGELGGATETYLHSTPRAPGEVAATGMGFSPTLTGGFNFLFSAFWFRGPQKPAGPPPADQPLLQVGDAGGCTFNSSPPAEAYAPGCPTGAMDGNFATFRALGRFSYLQWGSIANIHPGQYGRGNYAVHTGIRNPGFVGFWLDLTS